ncbi:hypothetical protein JD844_010036, partial [Phrynosoma platyrhinos]
MEAEEFLRNFIPSGLPKVTYLLYEIHWGRGHRRWRYWCRNIHPKHAEIIFLKDEEIHDRPNIPCKITWFLPWTPCGACAHEIIEFLEEHPNVTLDIRAAQVYRPHDRRNRRGLRALAEKGVQISIMNISDYQYCWNMFVDHQGINYMLPRYFLYSIWLNSLQLHSVLKSLRQKIQPKTFISSDYLYCWRTFVVPQKNGEDYWPWHFFPKIISCSQQLCSILE